MASQFCSFCLPTFVVAEVVLKPCVNFCKDLQHIKGLEFQFKILGVVRADERYQTVEEFLEFLERHGLQIASSKPVKEEL